MNKIIRVKKLNPDVRLPSKVRNSDIGFDLFSYSISANYENNMAQVIIKTGISLAPPEGYYCEIHPRSSITKHNLMLHNSTGIIDPEYRGELKIILWASNPADALAFVDKYNGQKNHSIAQLILRKIETSTIEEVDSLDDTNRGSGGFGSTDQLRTA